VAKVLIQPNYTKRPEEARRSWWTTAAREGFTAEALVELERMARSVGADKLHSSVVVGWKVSGRKS
jgi:hypothetical protein